LHGGGRDREEEIQFDGRSELEEEVDEGEKGEGKRREGGGGWVGAGGEGRTRSRAPSHNAKSFYCFSQWEKAGLRFQCILKSILHEKPTNELLISLYSLLRVSTKQLYM